MRHFLDTADDIVRLRPLVVTACMGIYVTVVLLVLALAGALP